MLVKNHTDMFYTQVHEQVITVPLLAPLVPIWIEVNTTTRKTYFCPLEEKQKRGKVTFSSTWVCFGGTGGRGSYHRMEETHVSK